MILSAQISDQKGQTFIETLICGLLFSGLVIFAFGIILNLTARTLLIRWAHVTARCVATSDAKDRDTRFSDCKYKTETTLRRAFRMKNIEIDVKEENAYGAIHCEVRGTLIGKKQLVGKFDLQADEFKRVVKR